MDTIDAIQHVKWTVEHSPQAYGVLRHELIELSRVLQDAELNHKTENEK